MLLTSTNPKQRSPKQPWLCNELTQLQTVASAAACCDSSSKKETHSTQPSNYWMELGIMSLNLHATQMKATSLPNQNCTDAMNLRRNAKEINSEINRAPILDFSIRDTAQGSELPPPKSKQ
jgi:hypothetical protein